MDDLKDILKKYWPYILGGIVGIYLILRYTGGGSASAGGGDYAAFLQAQSAAAQQNAALQAQQAQIDAQKQAVANQLQLDRDALNAAIAKDNATIDLQKAAVQAEAFNNFTTSQAAMAQSMGSSTAAVINALNAPALTAMQANAAENAAALNAAANAAAAGYLAQSEMVASGSNLAAGIASAIQPIQFPGGGSQQEGKFSQALNLAGRGVAAYYTMGASEAVRGGSSYYR